MIRMAEHVMIRMAEHVLQKRSSYGVSHMCAARSINKFVSSVFNMVS